MNALKSLVAIATLLLFNFNYSQTGPGGVGNSSSNGLWLSADNLILADGSSIDTWPDVSGNNNHATSIAGEQPLFQSSSVLNTMPAVRLDGVNDQMTINDADILDGTTGITFFMVLRPNNLDGNPRGILGKRIIYTNPTNYAYTWFFHNSNYLNLDINTQNNRFNSSPTAFSNSSNYILQMHFDGSLTSQRSKIYNGQTLSAQSSETSTSLINSTSNLVLGALNYNYGDYLGADITEVIHYNYALNSAEQIIVNNYLSAKYNIALASDNMYTQDNAANGNFDHNVAGIGQASDGSHHTDSRGTGIVTINSPSVLANGDYLFWGEETKNPTCNFSINTVNYTEELDSKWRVNKVNNLGTVTVIIDITSVNLTGKKPCSNLQLVVDNDSDFSSPTSTYNLTISGNTATATSVNFNDGDYFSLRYIDQIAWNGATSTFLNGSRGDNSPDDTNDSCLKLLIKAGSTAILNQNAHVREIEIESGATLNVADGALLEVENGIVNNGTINLLGEAQLIQNHTTGTTLNTGTGFITARQQGTGNDTSYNYWSSPVNTLNDSWQIKNLEDGSGNIIPFSPSYNAATPSPITLSSRWLYTFNGPNNYDNWVKIETDTDLEPGIGYTMKGSGSGTDQEYIFRGTPNDGNYSISVSANNEILIGNPYPSALDADIFITENLAVFEAVYLWESFTSNNSHYLADYEGGYATYNLLGMEAYAIADASGLTSGLGSHSKGIPTKNISVGQGFFVKSPSGGTIEFNNGQRVFARKSATETVFYKNSNTKNQQAAIEDTRPKLWFSMIDTKGYNKTIGLGYDTNTTLQYDRGYDAEPIDYLKDHMYWQLDNKKLVIQALPEINTADVLPMAMEVTNPGVFKFSISKMENVPDDLTIYLLDNEQNIYYNLRDGEAQFAINTKGNQNQFSIVFQDQNILGVNEFDKNNAFVSYNSNSKILELHYAESITSIENLKFYNTLGQEVKNIKTPDSSRIDISHLTDGVYILQVNRKNMKESKSIKFIKY